MSPFVEVRKCSQSGNLTVETVFHHEDGESLKRAGWPVETVSEKSDCFSCWKRALDRSEKSEEHPCFTTVVNVKPKELPKIEPNAFFKAAMIVQGFAFGESLPKIPKNYHQHLREIALGKAKTLFSATKR